jgi:hypothetical protein
MNSRAKGARGEREAAKAIKANLKNCTEAARGCQFSGSKDSPDVKTSGLTGIHFEVKRVEKESIHTWMDQAVRDAGSNTPVVLHRRNGQTWILSVRLEDADELAAKLMAAQASAPTQTLDN